ncbi:hypothetical protein ERW49_18220 [Aliivibrio finisterrensis]|uniref:DUF4231 domain-containing protein n=1 Tax=Aliivibrio finisterrensis TaxID=511998 RepID=A0A4Q5K8G3_9GAMM|nr:hypothetical protein [Aliivibrio finisterrensis]RYU42114.1 hypothetical protein ERW49_18220 [Aliivibrio finisterrensis]
MEIKELASLTEVEEQIKARIKDFNSRRHELKNYKNSLTICQAILSSITTVVIAINAKLMLDELAFIAIFISTISSLAGLFLSKFMFHERLTSQINTICSLRELNATIQIRKKMELDDPNLYQIKLEDVGDYFNQLQIILNVANNDWQKLAKDKKK